MSHNFLPPVTEVFRIDKVELFFLFVWPEPTSRNEVTTFFQNTDLTKPFYPRNLEVTQLCLLLPKVSGLTWSNFFSLRMTWTYKWNWCSNFLSEPWSWSERFWSVKQVFQEKFGIIFNWEMAFLSFVFQLFLFEEGVAGKINGSDGKQKSETRWMVWISPLIIFRTQSYSWISFPPSHSLEHLQFRQDFLIFLHVWKGLVPFLL